MSTDDITRIYQKLFPTTPLNPGGSLPQRTQPASRGPETGSLFDTEDKVTIGEEARNKSREAEAASLGIKVIRGGKR